MLNFNWNYSFLSSFSWISFTNNFVCFKLVFSITKSDILIFFLSLHWLFIIALIVLLIYLMKKLQGGSFNKLTQGSDIEILEMTPLGQHQKIISVKVQSKILVLGVTQTTINTLTTFEGSEAQKYLMDTNESGITSGQFSQTVNQLLGKFKKDARAPSDTREQQ